MAIRSYLSTRRGTGGSPSSTECTKTHIIRVVSAKFKAILIEGQACRLKFIRRANDTVQFTCETRGGRPPASSFFDIVAP